MEVWLGIDAGGTHTRAAAVDGDGRIIGTGTAGAGNIRDIGEHAVVAHMKQAIAQAMASSPVARATSAFLAMAGVWTDAERAAMFRIVQPVVPAEHVQVGGDLHAALAGAFAGGSGIVLIAGTGSVCFGRNDQGQTWRAGGYGSPLDDGGSATWLGLQAITACIRASDGRGQSTAIHPLILDALEIRTLRDVLAIVGGGQFPRQRIASLARLVTAAAADGDSVCLDILRRGTDKLAQCCAAVATRLDMINPVVCISGGLTQCDVFRACLADALPARGIRKPVVEPLLPPLLGAVLLAMPALDPQSAVVRAMIKHAPVLS